MEGLTAIVGGTVLGQINGLTERQLHSEETPYGDPSSPITVGLLDGHPVAFLARHGDPHRIPPHRVNYRANIWALKHLNATRIIAVNAVGSISPGLQLTDLVIVDQIIDYTYGRAHTFFEEQVQHIDFTYPFDETLRTGLIRAANCLDDEQGPFGFSGRGTYGCTQGPRLETAAEIQRMGKDGCDVVGMTCMPEAALARELGLAYSAISLVVNKAAGIDGEIVALDAIGAAVDVSVQKTINLLQRFLALP